ncbi:MAG: hypothetical protein ACR2MA_00215 [Egibacteraceae bacterium]
MDHDSGRLTSNAPRLKRSRYALWKNPRTSPTGVLVGESAEVMFTLSELVCSVVIDGGRHPTTMHAAATV